ncbi:MAG: hypothetical protein ACRETD_10840, partial [Steroidobacteraceae bacterium]
MKGARIAGFPPIAPPAQFLKLILERAGLDPIRDVTIYAARDDIARAGLLAAGDVDAAVISSAIPPAEMEHAGFSQISFFGDALRVPTTGLAVTRSLLQREGEAVRAMVTAYAQSLALLQQDASAAPAVLEQTFRVPTRSLAPTCNLLRRCFTGAGRSPPDVTDGAVTLMAGLLGITAVPAGSPYDFSLLPKG